MTPETLANFPAIAAVDPHKIPRLLKSLDRWVVWRAGPTKPDGKFAKLPVGPVSGRAINALAPANWLTFIRAMAACTARGAGHGIGIVLADDKPIDVGGELFVLTALDFDQCHDRMAELRELWLRLGQPYVEVSPSGKGLRMLGLSRNAVRSGNAGGGRELYSTRRFVSVTGVNGRGEVKDFSAGIAEVEARWFPDRRPLAAATGRPAVTPRFAETPQNVAMVECMLACISSDTDYDTYRAICWSVASIGWECAVPMVHAWSATTPGRYDSELLDRLMADYDPSRGISLATLRYHALKAGYVDHEDLIPPAAEMSHCLLMTASQLRSRPTAPSLVRGILPARGLAAIYGESGSGKSFLALDLAHAIAGAREDWFGFPVRHTAVAYFGLEGENGIGRRTMALEANSGVPCSNNLRFWSGGLSILDSSQLAVAAAAIVQAVGTGAVAVIDTLNQASPGVDENSSADMGRIISAAKELEARIEGLVILVHHSGKDRSRGPRGHSSLFAALDAVIEVHASAAGREWKLKKNKDGDASVCRDFELIPYPVASDEWGALSSCGVKPAVHAKSVAARTPTGKHQKLALATVRQLLTQSTSDLKYKEVLRAVTEHVATDHPRAAARVKEAVDGLIRAGHLTLNEGAVGLP